MTGRIGIDDIRPQINGGATPSRAVVDGVIPAFAVIQQEGHGTVNATLNVKRPKESAFASRSQRIPMHFSDHNPNRVNATFVPDVPGLWTIRIDAWSDPMAAWRNAITKKFKAGQSEAGLANDLGIDAALLDRATADAVAVHRNHLRSIAVGLRGDGDLRAHIAAALSDKTRAILQAHPVRDLLTRKKTHRIKVDRREALYSSQHEFFPRSDGGHGGNDELLHGTFKTAVAQLDRAQRMGFGTVYLPPIHPIDEINRKGRDNTLTPKPSDVGSPWAIGSAEGGHNAIHPSPDDEEDFKEFIKAAKERDLEVTVSLALQCAPDHPWAEAHPEWFTVLPDGTVTYTESPPKKYRDIYPLNFDNDAKDLYAEILHVVKFWIKCGVRVFRVDNPRTKPDNFWG